MSDTYIDPKSLGAAIRGLRNAKVGLEALERLEIAIGTDFTKGARDQLNSNVRIHVKSLAGVLVKNKN